MCMQIYLLPDRDGNGTKISYPLNMGMGMKFYFGDGDDIVKPTPSLLPSLGFGGKLKSNQVCKL